MTSPSPKPAWWLPLCRYRYGLGPRPASAPKPAPAWCFAQWTLFDHWGAWVDGGKRPPRPDIWATVPGWAWTLRRELLAAHKPPPPTWPPIAPPRIGSVDDVLLEPGVYMYSAANTPFGADGFAGRCKEHGIRWAALLVHEGLGVANEVQRPPGFVKALRDHGIVPVAWGSVFERPAEEARVAVRESAGFDRYIVDGEQAWKLTGPEGQHDEVAFARADTFANAWAEAAPQGLAGAVSTTVGADIHFRPLYTAGFRVLHPQTYSNQFPGLTPAYGIQRAFDSVQADFPGWRRESCAPTAASYEGFSKSMAEWTPELEAAGCAHRWNYYSGEFLTEADFAAIGRLVGA